MTIIHTYISSKKDGSIRTICDKKDKNADIFQKMGVKFDQIIFAKRQIHSTKIFEPKNHEVDEFDASITNKKNIVLCAFAADCLGITFTDEKNEIIAVAHCGRRGTENRLAQKVVKKMLDYGAELENIICKFGPSIAQENYEVTMDCGMGFFPEAKKQISQEKQLLDIPLENKLQLLEVGILEKNIILSEVDTYTDEHYFSHRRGDTGRFGNFIWMTE